VLTDNAKALIVRGKEQGYLTPDDIQSTFPDLKAESDQIPRVFAAFRDLGIEVTDDEKDHRHPGSRRSPRPTPILCHHPNFSRSCLHSMLRLAEPSRSAVLIEIQDMSSRS
jgi:Sigma-70 factor, region 1.1